MILFFQKRTSRGRPLGSLERDDRRDSLPDLLSELERDEVADLGVPPPSIDWRMQ